LTWDVVKDIEMLKLCFKMWQHFVCDWLRVAKQKVPSRYITPMYNTIVSQSWVIFTDSIKKENLNNLYFPGKLHVNGMHTKPLMWVFHKILITLSLLHVIQYHSYLQIPKLPPPID
jgi:hypothetical protein